MPQLLSWIERHWLGVFLVAALLMAIVFVLTNRKSLFYKE